MRPDQLGLDRPAPPGRSVPDWALGCFIRRSITYANGIDDTKTLVAWVQSHGLTGDLRIPRSRPQLEPGTRLDTLDRDTLARLASVEGSLAETCWDGRTMSWGAGPSYQPYTKWPEPAELRRVGNALLEFAPSGIYVEDWRLQPSAPGPVIGLRLVSETDHQGVTTPRTGGLVMAGDHAIICLGRPANLSVEGRLQDHVGRNAQPLMAYRDAAACVTHYLRREANGFVIIASTDPLASGISFLLDGFEQAEDGQLDQIVAEDGVTVARRWTIDSAAPSVTFGLSTPATAEAEGWLAGEADTLLDPLGGRS